MELYNFLSFQTDFNANIEIMLITAALHSVGKRSFSGVSSCMVEASIAAGGAAQGRGVFSGPFISTSSHSL